MAIPAVLCGKCAASQDIREEFNVLTPADINLNGLSHTERMLAFIYCATGDISGYFEDFSLKNEGEEDLLNVRIAYLSDRNFVKYRTPKKS
jgi:hypothetical protein